MDWSAPRRRINRDAVLSQESPGVAVTFTPGGQQEILCLPLDSISGWLFGIKAARVNRDVRERLIRYQHECYQVLAEALQDSCLTTDTGIDIDIGYACAARESCCSRSSMSNSCGAHGPTAACYGSRARCDRIQANRPYQPLDQLESAVGGKHVTEA